jgi:F-type H+-transporting ATPase subunit a
MELEELANHVCDTTFFHLPWAGHVHLGTFFGGQLTRFMILELIAVGLMFLMFRGLARRLESGTAVKGVFWNALELLVLFIRDEVARPAIGKHDADRYVPLLWNLFFFIVMCNLLGLFPYAGSPTASLAVTAALALITFGTVLFTGMKKFGVGGYWLTLIPHMDLPPALRFVMVPMIFVIEFFGLFIRHAVLAVRLLANMFAGHLVLAVIVSFIVMAAKVSVTLSAGVAVPSLAAAVALMMLELFFAFLQAYIFTFLSALFIGMTVHPH